MRSTSRPRAHTSQSGVSLIEALVASALLGIGIVAGMTAWDTATLSAQHGVRGAWARCVVRAELDGILAAPWADSYPPPAGQGAIVTVDVRPVPHTSGPGSEQVVTVRAIDPQAGAALFGASVVKVRALEGAKLMQEQAVTADVALGCPAP